MIRRYITASSVALLLASPAGSAPIDNSELARCHAIASRDRQLECYEALAAAALSQPSATSTAPASAVLSAAPAAATAPAAGEPARAARSVDPDAPANFGLTRHQVEPHADGPSAVKSIVSQITEDRRHNVTVVLDNGQTWNFIEPEPRVRPGDSVTIKRASLGSFLMLTPSRRSYRVERLK